MHTVPRATFLLVFLRTYLVGAAFNMRGLQNVGFMYAMDPALAAIHRDPGELRKARNRYARHYNCHPYWTPLVAGMLLHTESEIANGRMSPEVFASIKDTAVNTLSALGDSVFGGTLLVTWALAMASLIISGHAWVALASSAALFVALQLFKLGIFIAGVRFGLTALFWMRRWGLINWGDRLKIVNAFLLLLFLLLCLPEKDDPALWGLAVVCIILAAWLTARLHIPRALLALAATTAVLLLV
ncbi:MAG: PTS system mannose/fructose/sorbose family transporter subunit IID [Deltaproteobacteria bacterium]|nr:PTS system mannose/fructose/sorbose family transporter subunit IID [Deltaproteobacteria bacterium]